MIGNKHFHSRRFLMILFFVVSLISLIGLQLRPGLPGNLLSALSLSSSFKVSAASSATGPLKVDSSNPRYFMDGTGKAILLVGDHTWYTMQDGGNSSPPAAFDYTTYLDSLQANHINFFRFFVWEQTRCSELVGCNWYYDPPIYQRPGPGTAYDGKPKFDLTLFNQAYFDRLRQRVQDAGQKGIYVSIQLFDGFSVENKGYGSAPGSPFPGHPFNINNNVNGINGDPNSNGDGEEIETLNIPAVTSLQDAYVKKVIDSVNDLDNVLFEICNESNGSTASTAWENHMIDLIHTYEAGKPKQHPVGFTVEWPGGNNADLFASHADWISPNGDYYTNPPAADGSKVVITDTDHLCYPCGDRYWMWESVTRGYNPAFMDPYDCKGDPSPAGCTPNDPTSVSLRQNLGYALTYTQRMNLEATAPHGELSSSGYALANPSATNGEYLIYLPSGGTVTVNLSATPGPVSVEWLNPSNGNITTGSPVTGGTLLPLTAPFSGDAVLYLYQNTSSPTSTPGASSTSTSISTVTNTPAFSPTPTSSGPVIMGESNILGSDDSGNGNLLIAQQAALSQNATLQSLSFYVNSPSGNLRLGLYSDAGGKPQTLLAQTAQFTPVSGWNTQNVVAPVLLNAGTFWLAYLPESSNLHFSLANSGTAYWYSYSFGVLPTTFSSSPQSGTYHWSFFATLSAGGPVNSPTPTATLYLSPTSISTVTRTQTNAPSQTITATATPILTNTPKPTSTALPTFTSTPSVPPTLTKTPANSPTPTSSGSVTMGESSVLGSDDSGNGNLLVAQQVTLSKNATLQSLSFYVTSPSGNLRLGVYSDAGGKPKTLLAQTAQFTPVSGWNTQNVITPVLLNAGTYWLAYLPESSSLHFKMAPSGTARWYSYSFGALPTTFSSSPQAGTYHWSFYATLH